jgi:formylglycine-generating enzyme required for sulfatase activity
MGTSADSFEDAAPEHVTYVDTYCLDRTEVTVASYQRCVEAGWCEQTPAPSPAGSCNAGAARAEHPMNCVAWAEALVFCSWRGMRLPTEAEWELAAAGRGSDLPWGSDPPESRAVLGGGAQGTQPAGSLPQGASKDGALDLVGNVAEWVADFYGPYSDGQAVNPVGPDTGPQRVVRGGAWRGTRVVREKTDVGWRFAAKVREGVAPDRRSDTVGFRCAKSLR